MRQKAKENTPGRRRVSVTLRGREERFTQIDSPWLFPGLMITLQA